MRKKRSPIPRSVWSLNTTSPTSRTRRWSRSTARCASRTAAARSGPEPSSRPWTRCRRRASPACRRKTSPSIPSSSVAASAGALLRRPTSSARRWRSVGNTHTAFAMESMIDELAWAARKDPLEYRLALLADKPRHLRALKTAAEKAGWGKAPPNGRARGLAVHESFGSIIAEVAEVSVDEHKEIHVHKVSCTVDCGMAINPLGVEAQVQGAVAFGLSAVLQSELTLKDGRVEQSNFHDYEVLRLPDMPEVAVHIIESDAKMGGIGEPATAPISAAVANAVYALTKQRLRSLPLRLA